MVEVTETAQSTQIIVKVQLCPAENYTYPKLRFHCNRTLKSIHHEITCYDKYLMFGGKLRQIYFQRWLFNLQSVKRSLVNCVIIYNRPDHYCNVFCQRTLLIKVKLHFTVNPDRDKTTPNSTKIVKCLS